MPHPAAHHLENALGFLVLVLMTNSFTQHQCQPNRSCHSHAEAAIH